MLICSLKFKLCGTRRNCHTVSLCSATLLRSNLECDAWNRLKYSCNILLLMSIYAVHVVSMGKRSSIRVCTQCFSRLWASNLLDKKYRFQAYNTSMRKTQIQSECWLHFCHQTTQNFPYFIKWLFLMKFYLKLRHSSYNLLLHW